MELLCSKAEKVDAKNHIDCIDLIIMGSVACLFSHSKRVQQVRYSVPLQYQR